MAGRPKNLATNGPFARQQRERKGYSQARLAEVSDVAERTIRDVENGRGASATSLVELAKALGLENWHDLLDADERSQFGSTNPTVPLAPAPVVEPPPNRRFQLPAALTDFVGRVEDKAKIVARLSGGEKVGLSSAFRGMGGVGKTSLAVVVAHAVKHLYPDAQLFLELRGVSDSPVTPVDAMSRIIRDFHPETGKLPDTVEELQPQYLSVLSGKRALIVLDNAKDEAQVKPLLAAGPPVVFLLTSRNALRLNNVDCVRLDVLPPPDALALLREIVGEKGTDAELNEVAELCGCLPLALRVAGSYLQTYEDCEVAEYARDLKAFGLEQLQKGVTDKDQDVELVLSHSARALVRDNPVRAARWQMLSVFPADFAPDAAAAVWELDERNATDELRALFARSLVEYDSPTKRYSLHDLMRPVAMSTFEYEDTGAFNSGTTERIRTAQYRFAKHYCDAMRTVATGYLEGNSLQLIGLFLFDLEAPNIRHGQLWTAANQEDSEGAAELCRDYSEFAALFSHLRLTALEWNNWLNASLQACRKLRDRRREGYTFGNLGNAAFGVGNTSAAVDYFQQALAILREVRDRGGEANALGSLGNAYSRLGDDRAALAFHAQHLVIAREIKDRRSEGSALGHLGLVHKSLGDPRTAVTFLTQALAISREFGDRYSEANDLTNLGLALSLGGQSFQAVTFHEQALAIFKSIGYQHGIASAEMNLALALRILGLVDDAIRHASHALELFKSTEAPNAEKVRRHLAEWRAETGGASADGSA